MSIELHALIRTFEGLWPTSQAEEWDSVGLVSGDINQKIARVLLSVDVTAELIEEAEGFDLVLSHHPLLLRGINSVAKQTSKGSVLVSAIQSGIALYAAHTNADAAIGGVSDSLATAIGLKTSEPLVKTSVAGIGSGRIGTLPQAQTLLSLAQRLGTVLPSTAGGIKVAGNHESTISRVGLCGGAGDSFIEAAYEQGADVFITSDLRHHPVQEALEKAAAEGREISFIDVSHWAGEWVWLNNARDALKLLHPDVHFEVSDLRTDPWDFVVTQ